MNEYKPEDYFKSVPQLNEEYRDRIKIKPHCPSLPTGYMPGPTGPVQTNRITRGITSNGVKYFIGKAIWDDKLKEYIFLVDDDLNGE